LAVVEECISLSVFASECCIDMAAVPSMGAALAAAAAAAAGRGTLHDHVMCRAHVYHQSTEWLVTLAFVSHHVCFQTGLCV
jgi:hypothetical protein